MARLPAMRLSSATCSRSACDVMRGGPRLSWLTISKIPSSSVSGGVCDAITVPMRRSARSSSPPCSMCSSRYAWTLPPCLISARNGMSRRRDLDCHRQERECCPDDRAQGGPQRLPGDDARRDLRGAARVHGRVLADVSSRHARRGRLSVPQVRRGT